MKKFNTLLELEYNGMFVPLCALCGITAALESALFGWRLSYNGGSAPFSYLVDASGVPAVFAVAFAALLTLIAVRFSQNYAPSKSVYALLTLPVKRERVYMAKLAAALVSGLALVSVQLVLLIAFEACTHIPGPVARTLAYVNGGTARGANLYLALLDTGFLRLLFPPDVFSLAFSICALTGAVCLALSVAAQLKAGRVWQAVSMAVFWLIMVILAFPLGHYKLWQSAVKLLFFVACPITVTLAGIRVFETGEAAA